MDRDPVANRGGGQQTAQAEADDGNPGDARLPGQPARGGLDRPGPGPDQVRPIGCPAAVTGTGQVDPEDCVPMLRQEVGPGPAAPVRGNLVPTPWPAHQHGGGRRAPGRGMEHPEDSSGAGFQVDRASQGRSADHEACSGGRITTRPTRLSAVNQPPENDEPGVCGPSRIVRVRPGSTEKASSSGAVAGHVDPDAVGQAPARDREGQAPVGVPAGHPGQPQALLRLGIERPPGREMEGLRQQPGRAGLSEPQALLTGLEAGHDRVLGRRPEAIGPGCVDEVAEDLLDVALDRAVGRHADRHLGAADRHFEVAVQADPEAGLERVRPVVGDMGDDPADALIHEPDRGWGQDPAEVVVGRLRPTEIVDHAPTGTGDQIAQPQDQTAPRRRAGPAPLAVDQLHHLAGDRPGKLQVAVRIAAPEDVGVDSVEHLEVVVAQVIEVPACPGITGYARLPTWVVDERLVGWLRDEPGQRLVIGHVGKGQALGREQDPAGSSVGQWRPVAAHAVVAGNAPVGPHRQVAAERGGRDVDRVDPGSFDHVRNHVVEERDAGEGEVEAQHGDLLLHFAVSADDGQAGPAAHLGQELGDLGLSELAKGLIGERVVHAHVHQVLPDHDPELVAQVVERLPFVGAEAGQAEHVHPGRPDRLDRRPKVTLRRSQAHDVEGCPQCAPSEDRDSVDVDEQAVALDLVLRRGSGREAAEANPASFDRHFGVLTNPQPNLVEHGLAMGVGPPAGHCRDPKLAIGVGAEALGPGFQGNAVPAGWAIELERDRSANGLGQAPKAGMDGQDAVLAVEDRAAARGRRRPRARGARSRPAAMDQPQAVLARSPAPGRGASTGTSAGCCPRQGAFASERAESAARPAAASWPGSGS